MCSGGVKKHRDCGERFTLGKEMASVRTVGAQRSGAEWEVKPHLRSSRKKVAAELKCLESEDLKFGRLIRCGGNLAAAHPSMPTSTCARGASL